MNLLNVFVIVGLFLVIAIHLVAFWKSESRQEAIREKRKIERMRRMHDLYVLNEPREGIYFQPTWSTAVHPSLKRRAVGDLVQPYYGWDKAEEVTMDILPPPEHEETDHD